MASRLRAEFNTSAIWCTGSCTNPNKTDFWGFAKASTAQKPDGEFNVHRQTDFQSCECNVIFSGYSFAFGLFKWQMQAGVTRYLITCPHVWTSEEMYGTYTFYYFFCILNCALKISGWMSTNSYLHTLWLHGQLFACVNARTATHIENWTQKLQVWELWKMKPLLRNRTAMIWATGI